MSKYKELQTALTTLETVSANYWSHLEEIVQKIPSSFLEYLGVDSQPVMDLSGNMVPIILLGKYENGEVVRSLVQRLERDDKTIKFSMRLALCGEGGTAKIFIVYHIKATRYLENVRFSIEHFEEDAFCQRSDETSDVELKPLFDLIFAKLTSQLSPMKFL
ncbi:hypothetical protein ACMAUW_004347 [Citrobacter farmeri]